jgi:hypothetical protein
MEPFIDIRIHMLKERVKQLEKQAHEDFRYNESLLARLVCFVRKEAAKKEAAKKGTTEKEAAEKEAAEKEAVKKEEDDDDDDDEEDQQA